MNLCTDQPRARRILALTEQSQNRVRRCIGLRQHGRASLNQDRSLGEMRAFLRHVEVFNPAVGGGKVVLKSSQMLGGRVQTRHAGAHGSAVCGQLVDRGLHHRQGRGGTAHGADVPGRTLAIA